MEEKTNIEENTVTENVIPEPKAVLVNLLNTYCDARITGNQNLIRFAAMELETFLQRVTITEVQK